MKTISEILALSAKFLEDRKVDRAKRIAEELLAWVLQVKRLDLYLQFDRPVDEQELSLLRDFLKRSARGEPVEYIFGEVEFSGCKIGVDQRVLIPRPETEILVEKIKQTAKGSVIWDICTGSGCIGIALKKAFPLASVSLSDLSQEALTVAEKNAALNGVIVDCFLGDLLEPFHGKKADVVVCNPPYISTNELVCLSPSVRDFEPLMALDGGADGGVFYQKLAHVLPAHLHSGARVFLEIGANQGDLVKKIFQGGPWKQVSLEKDWAGHDRFFSLEMQ